MPSSGSSPSLIRFPGTIILSSRSATRSPWRGLQHGVQVHVPLDSAIDIRYSLLVPAEHVSMVSIGSEKIVEDMFKVIRNSIEDWYVCLLLGDPA